MKKNAFTLIELLAVIVILGLTVTLIAVRVEKNIKDSKELATEYQVELIEDAAILYVTKYKNELTMLNTINIDNISLNDIIEKGLIDPKDLSEIDINNTVLIANIDGTIKTNYDKYQQNKNVIFLEGPDALALKKGSTYNELGAYVAVVNTGVIKLTESNITSNLNTNIEGNYTITYSYNNANNVNRNVKIS